jgi:hypothetical protein
MLMTILLLLISTSLYAEECRPVNLLTQPSSPFLKLPVYHQEKTNICYAYAAAQLADYYLIQQGAETKSVHPLWLAYNYAQSRGRKHLDIGHTRLALQTLKESANCHFGSVSQALKHWPDSESKSEARIISEIEKHKAEAPVEILRRMMEPYCQQRTKTELPAVISLNHTTLRDETMIMSIIHHQINTAPAPLSISYCSNIWKRPDYHGVSPGMDGVRNRLSDDCHYHESIIIGRKPAENSCKVLVRNTLGAGWSPMNKQWKCVCQDKVSGAFIDDCEFSTHADPKYSVEACWLPLAQLSRNIGVLTFLGPNQSDNQMLSDLASGSPQ